MFFLFLFVLYSFSEVHLFPTHRFKIPRSQNHPFLHPFSSHDHLLKNIEEDPLGFSHKHYHHSLTEFETIFESHNHHDKLHRIEHDTYDYSPETGYNTTLVYEGHMLSGTWDLDDEDVQDIVCNNENEVIVYTKDFEMLKMMIPGSRIHFGFKWKNCEEKMASRYSIVHKRKDYEERNGVHKIVLNVEGLSFHEMFHNVKVDFQHTPVHEPQQTRRGHIDTRESLLFFGFNWDKKEKRVVNNDVNWYKDDYSSIDCNDCYAYVDSGIILQVDTGLFKIKSFKVGVYGEEHVHFEVEYNFQLGFHWDKRINFFTYKFPSIKFMIGSIPLYLTPSIQLDGEAKVDFDVQFNVKTTFKSDAYAEYTLNYDGDKIFSESIWNPPTLDFTEPYIDSSKSHAHLDVELSAYPAVWLYVYAIAPVQFTAIPKFYFHGDADTKKLEYNTAYSVDAQLELAPLEIPKDIPELGGHTYTFGGRLPWGKTFHWIEKTQLKCKWCSGEIDYSIPSENL